MVKRIGMVMACAIIILVSCVSVALPAKSVIRVLYVNDFHGFAEPYKPVGSDQKLGGIAYLSARADQLRKETPSLFLAAGDMIQGNDWANLTLGKSVIELMNIMRFDAMVVGNHEFDFGQHVLKKRISEAEFPVLGANVEGIDILKPYIIRTIAIGGVRVAILGIVTDETPVSTYPGNVAGLKFIPPETAVRRYLPVLRSKADIVIVLSHIGYSADRRLAADVKGIDVIVGGHSHTKLLKPVVVGKTIIVQAWEHAKALGVLDLVIEDGKIESFGGRLEEIRPDPDHEDKAVLEVVERYKKVEDSVLGEVIGESAAGFDGENVRRGETNLGDFVADIMRSVSGANAAIINGGGIRASINKGKIERKDIYNVLPFDDCIVVVKLTGRQIGKALEHGVSAVEEESGRFPQVSGIKFTYSRSARPGSRLMDFTIDGKPLRADKVYTVAINDFLAAGGDGYKVLAEAAGPPKDFVRTGCIMKGESLDSVNSGRSLRDMVIGYIKEKKLISPPEKGRIREIP
jgi:5'-nucleotidase/UDP-sugar diphosphatase